MSTRSGRRLKLDDGDVGGKKRKESSSGKEEGEEKAPDVSVVEKATNSSSSFFSPKRSTKKAATVTPSPSAAKKRRSLLQDESEGETPKKKKKNKKKADAEDAAISTSTTEEPYVPTYIHKNVGYARFGTALDRLSDGQKLAFAFVADKYHIPADFETNRKFGPLSGSSYEERVLAAYATDGLAPSEGADLDVIRKGICTFCGELGHKKKLCPELL